MKGCIRVVPAVLLGAIVLTYVTVRVRNQFVLPAYIASVDRGDWYASCLRMAGLDPDKEGMFRYQFRCGGRLVTVTQTTSRLGRRKAEVRVDGRLVEHDGPLLWGNFVGDYNLRTDFSGRRLFLKADYEPVAVFIYVYPDWYWEPASDLRVYNGRSYYTFRQPDEDSGTSDFCISAHLKDAKLTCVYPSSGTNAPLPKDAPEVFHEIVRTFEMW